MIDFKKMDDKDFVFVKNSLSHKEEEDFSEFLKSRKTKKKQLRDTKGKVAPQLITSTNQ